MACATGLEPSSRPILLRSITAWRRPASRFAAAPSASGFCISWACSTARTNGQVGEVKLPAIPGIHMPAGQAAIVLPGSGQIRYSNAGRFDYQELLRAMQRAEPQNTGTAEAAVIEAPAPGEN